MIATLIALVIGWGAERKLPVMPLVSGIFVLFFGGLTLVLADETFIKLKPTLVNILFAAILFGGLVLGKSLLTAAVRSSGETERTRLANSDLGAGPSFFVVLAVLNEIDMAQLLDRLLGLFSNCSASCR